MNTLQTTAHDNFAKQGRREIASGAIPFSHSYGLLVGHLTVWRGDSLVVFPRFNMEMMLGCTPKYRVNRLYLVSLAGSSNTFILAFVADTLPTFIRYPPFSPPWQPTLSFSNCLIFLLSRML